ncbi:unnamed protein product [Urochloa decumbens]|uniref:NET domain-containing protein n=1 Tax=Urochloa decumbens TaxID=240449 RepID=A0ABC9CJZ1_9POAL
MALELAVRGGGVEEHPAPQRKGVLVRRGAFAVRREVIAVAKMSAPERRSLRERLDSELDAVRGALRKAELLSGGATAGAPAVAAAPPAAGKDGRLSAAGAEAAAAKKKKRKVPSFVGQGAGEPKRVKTGDRELLAGRLAALAAALPDRAVAFLQNRRVGGGADSGAGGAEKDARPMKGGDALFQLKTLLDTFAPAARTPKKSHGPRRAPPEITPESHRRRALPMVGSGSVSDLSRHQGGAGGGGRKMATVEEEEEGVDICGGVSRIAIRDIAEEYGELVEGVGVRLLSPLQRKYVDLTEQGDEYVDICGDASPVVFPASAKGKAAGDGRSTTSPSFSSSYGDTDASSSDSDSSSSSDSDSDESDPGKSFSSRPPPAIVHKEAVHTEKIAEPAVQDLRITSSPPAPAFLPPKVNDTNAPPPEPAPEMMQIAAEQEELQGRCAPRAPMAHPVTGSQPGPPALPKENDTNTQPPEPAAPPGAVQCLTPAAPAHPITGGGAPTSAVLRPEENGASSHQPPALPPVAAQVAEPEDAVAAPAAAPAPVAANGVSGLVTAAKEVERRRQLAKERAKAKARRALLEVERAALPDERVHPRDMELLGITAFEHVASTVQKGSRRAAPAPAPLQVNDGGGGGLRVSPGNPSVLQQLGIFLKADDGSDDDEEEEEQQKHQQVAAGLASHGDDEEVEDGEIR